VQLPGGGVLAYDGERTTPVSRESVVTATIELSGPRVLDVDAILSRAANDQLFDDITTRTARKDPHGN
jgi:hypothetical protein